MTHATVPVPYLIRKNRSNLAYALKGRRRFSWEGRSHSCCCELLSLVVPTCVETIADAEQQLNKTVVSSRLLLGVERLLFSLRCWLPGSDSVAAAPPGKIVLLINSIIEKKRWPLIEGNSRHGMPTKDACYAKAVKGVTPAVVS